MLELKPKPVEVEDSDGTKRIARGFTQQQLVEAASNPAYSEISRKIAKALLDYRKRNHGHVAIRTI